MRPGIYGRSIEAGGSTLPGRRVILGVFGNLEPPRRFLGLMPATAAGDQMMGAGRNKIMVPVDTSKLYELREQLYQLCKENKVPPQTARRIVLAIDEALSNVMEHGNLRTEEGIEVSIEFQPNRIVATMRDRGIPFDPTPLNGGPDRRAFPRRGFGLYLIHLIVDRIEYQRTNCGQNILTLTKSYV
jgi:anti-sigma regulatory factor (Ser/Thr protein kinase)